MGLIRSIKFIPIFPGEEGREISRVTKRHPMHHSEGVEGTGGGATGGVESEIQQFIKELINNLKSYHPGNFTNSLMHKLGIRTLAALAMHRDINKEAVPLLIQCLSDPDNQVRENAADAIAAYADCGQRDEMAIPPLIKCLSDQDSNVKVSAIRALAYYAEYEGAKQAVLPLTTCFLSDPNLEVKQFAALILSLIVPEEFKTKLSELPLRDKVDILTFLEGGNFDILGK
ncbi:MAG: HEAT repeat domain-containing protein [Candidatus Melainabacteria bacterium]|nr:HEAT repeat domain-containing protein [Candidatus Melainabacteria bacterium]